MGWFASITALIAAAFLGLLGWVIYDDVTSTKYTIRKDQFSCTQTRQEIQYMTQQIGTQITVVPYVVTVCDQYTRH